MEHEREPSEIPMGDVFADVPLFREIQRVLLASKGPVNWELARQVGIAAAQWELDDPEPAAGDLTGLEEDVRLAELRVAERTGLPIPADVARVQAVRRAGWVEATVRGLQGALEPAAAKIGEAIRSARPEGIPDEAAAAVSQVLGQLTPLLLGAQAGTVLGHLARGVFGQYDVVAPRSGPPTLLFVVSNIARFEREWSLPPEEFRAFVALHEVAHRFEFARPWVAARFRELLQDFHSTLQIDVEGIHERLSGLDVTDPEGFQRLLGSSEEVFGAVIDDEQRLKLGRIQALMIAAEGYADHVAHSVAGELLPAHARIEEAMRRYRETDVADPVFERLLGIEIKREQYRVGRAFCEEVARLTDEPTLGRMWEEPDASPSLPELEEPRLWLARAV